MKLTIKLSLLIIMMFAGTLAASSQNLNDTICVYTSHYDSLLYRIADLRERVKSLEPLRDDTAQLRNIISLQARELNRERETGKRIIDSLTSAGSQQRSIISDKNELLARKDKIIAQTGKVKRWGIGPAALYGLSGSSLGIAIGIGVTYSFFRW